MQRVLNVLHIVVKHAKEDATLLTLEGLDDEAVVGTEEEETATGAGTLACAEHFIFVGDGVK